MIDLHCDTILRICESRDAHQVEASKSLQGLRTNDFHVDLEKLRKGGSLAQTFALFVRKTEGKSSYETFLGMLDVFRDELAKNSDLVKQVLKPVRTDNQLLQAILSIEEGDVLEGRIDRVAEIASYGVRMIALTWNFENAIGYPNSPDPEAMGKGLKDFGMQLIPEMEKHGIIVDVSHLSEGGFWDVARISKRPFIASHSDCCALCEHPRNLLDEQIKAVAESGGVIGLNFCSAFLCEGSRVTRIEDLVRHAMHLYQIGGSAVLALGTDFDGIESTLEIPDVSFMPVLRDALHKAGMLESVLDAMWDGNALRVLC